MDKLIANQKTVMISSIDKNNNPAISYAPFVMIDEKIYIYISKAANHYYNLIENEKCAVMLIEDESKSKTIFARERVSFNCLAKKIENVDEAIFDKFNEVQDEKMISMFRKMDFDVFELSIIDGRLVKGFGQAFDIKYVDGEIQLVQITGIGHKN